MNDSNPYQSPATKSPGDSRSLLDFVLAGIWLAIPAGVFLGRQWLLPIYKEFDVPLPTFTRLMASLYAPVPLALITLVVLVGIFSLPHGGIRRLLFAIACVLGLIVGLVCLLSLALPLVSLMDGLSG